MGSNSNSLHHRKSGHTENSDTGITPEHRSHLALEDSLKLLNDAKISNAEYIDNLNLEAQIPFLKDPILDLTDGTDDYVPIKGESGYVTMNGNLDDIVVPELSKFGLTGVGNSAIWHEVLTDGGELVKTWFC